MSCPLIIENPPLFHQYNPTNQSSPMTGAKIMADNSQQPAIQGEQAESQTQTWPTVRLRRRKRSTITWSVRLWV